MLTAMTEQQLRQEFKRLTKAINTTLLRAHELGLSVISEANGYDVQLQDGELLQLRIGINDCVHKFQPITSIEQQIGKRKKPSKWLFERCSKCCMTRSVYT